jgi:hypothetical protein
MRPPRFTLATLMGLIVFVGVAIAALRDANQVWAGLTFTATLGILTTAVLGAAFGFGGRRAFLAGAAFFGFGYLVLATDPATGEFLLTTRLIDRLYTLMYPPASYFVDGASVIYLGPIPPRPEHFLRIGHCLIALLLACAGGTIARRFHVSNGGPDHG